MTKILVQSLAIAAAMGAGLYRDDTVGAASGTGTATDVKTADPAPTAPNGFVDMKETVFHFKKEKDTINPETKEVLQKGEKHPSVKMYLPVPKLERLVEFIANPDKFPKEIDLLQNAISDVIYGQARAQVNDFREKNPTATVTNAVLNYDKLDWTAIANMPKSERGAYAPSEEDLDSFLTSYAEVMPAATGKSPEAIANHVKLFKDGFKKQRGQKDILELFAGMMDIYITKAPAEAVADNEQVVEYFTNKLDRWLKAEATVTMDML